MQELCDTTQLLNVVLLGPTSSVCLCRSLCQICVLTRLSSVCRSCSWCIVTDRLLSPRFFFSRFPRHFSPRLQTCECLSLFFMLSVCIHLLALFWRSLACFDCVPINLHSPYICTLRKVGHTNKPVRYQRALLWILCVPIKRCFYIIRWSWSEVSVYRHTW